MSIQCLIFRWQVVFFLTVCLITTSQIARADVLTIGTISADPVEEIRVFQPFVDYLTRQLADSRFDKVKVAIARNISEIVGMLKRKEVDLYIDSSVTALIVNKYSGSKFMLRRWKKRRGKYRSVIFVNSDSNIKRPEDLMGKVIAFEEQFSTSGYILPALKLIGAGIKLSVLESFRSKPAADKVGYVLANDNETQIVWLERGRVAAAAMAESDYIDFSKNSLKPMMILDTTPYVPYHVVVHRAGLETKIVEHIKAVLKSAHEDEAGRAALKNFENTGKFDEIPKDLLNEVQTLTPHIGALGLSR